MDVAYDLTSLVAAKLVVYTFGTLVHLFLMVVILGNRRLRRFEWLLFVLMAGLFLWYVGNLLALNIGLHYGAGPAVLSGISRVLPFVGFAAAAPLLVHVQIEYLCGFIRRQAWQKLLVACFYLPVAACPWVAARMLHRLGVEPLVALGRSVRWLVIWAASALLVAAAVNLYLMLARRSADATLARLYAILASLQLFLAGGWTVAYGLRALPPVGGLGGYFPTALLLAGVGPSALVGYSILRFNFLDLRVQRNVIYAAVAIFGFLIYMNFMRRLSGWLEAHNILPAAATEGVMIFILVVLLEPVKRLVNRALHRRFLSEFENVQRIATELEEDAKRTGDVHSLETLVETRVAGALELARVQLWQGDSRPAEHNAEGHTKAQWTPVKRGERILAWLEALPLGPDLSGEQLAALEVLAARLAGALELCQLIAEKVKLERELAEKAKMAFLGEMAARIAHNVKNPLSSMKTIVQLLEEDQTLPEAARRDCRMLVDEIDRLNKNISQVLRYAKPARDTDRPVDLGSVAEKVAALLRMEAERRHVALHVVSEGECRVEGGEEAANDILSNLIVNALDASQEGRAIWICLRPLGRPADTIELSVEDEGRGIPKDICDRIFQPFFTTRSGGTGLGLAIVKRRVDEIGGSVKCESPVPEINGNSAHAGSRFVVRFRAASSLLPKA